MPVARRDVNARVRRVATFLPYAAYAYATQRVCFDVIVDICSHVLLSLMLSRLLIFDMMFCLRMPRSCREQYFDARCCCLRYASPFARGWRRDIEMTRCQRDAARYARY